MNRRITSVLSVLLVMSMVTAVLPYGIVFAEEEDIAVETEAEAAEEEAEESEVTEELEEPSEPEEIEEPDEVVEETVETAQVKKHDDQALIPVTYWEYSWSESDSVLKKNEMTVPTYTVVTSDIIKVDNPDGLKTGIYVVNTDTTIDENLYIRKEQTVDLIVLPGVTLTCSKGIGCGYAENEGYATLNIYGKGKIVTTGDKYCAGIGGIKNETNGNITIHDTDITATGGTYAAGIGGGDEGKDPDGTTSIKIYAGTVNATGGDEAAGIGGGNEQPGAHTYIYSGNITAKSNKLGAGIGGGDEEGTLGIFIYGGEVTATGGKHGAGIGAGEEGGDLRKVENGGGINIRGGKITATGGSGAAGIGGGYHENTRGDIYISGSVTLAAEAGKGAAGIGAGSGNPKATPERGDMKGTIRIDCTPQSMIDVYGIASEFAHNTSLADYTHQKDHMAYSGSGIGAGFGGNLEGEVYITGGKMNIWSGDGGAGIGGGMESGWLGGEGNDVYIGGGDITITTVCYADNSKRESTDNHAIGRGDNDYKDGSVYINANNNKTGNYMRVVYTEFGKYMNDDYEPLVTKTAKASDRSKKCHTKSVLHITECDHTDHNGKSGLTYTIDEANGTHTKKCKFCGLNETKTHSATDCECGYKSGLNSVTLNYQEGPATARVVKNSSFELPDDGNRLSMVIGNPDMWYLLTGWRSGDKVYEPGETVTVDQDMSFDAVRTKMYLIGINEAEHGTVSTVLTPYEYSGDKKTVAAAGETVGFKYKPEDGYYIDTLSYSYQGHDPIEITPDADGEYFIVMPGDMGANVNGITVTATFREFDTAGYCVVNGANVTLGGELGLNYYVSVPDDVAAGAKAVLDGPEGVREYALANMTQNDYGFKLTYSIKAIYMDKKVSIKLVDDKGDTIDLFIVTDHGPVRLSENTMETGIYDYVAAACRDTDLTEEELGMVNAMYTYGAYSIKWKYGTPVPDDVSDLPELKKDDLQDYEVVIDGSNDKIELVSMSLLLDSNTAYRIYFTCSDDIAKHVVLYNNEPLDIKATDEAGKYYVEIGDIGADRLTISKTITFDGTLDVGISPMSYVYLALKNGGQSDDLMNVLRAFCAYSDAARAMI